MNGEDGFVAFLCDHCHTEIEASPDLIGQETECPACGVKLVIPDGERQNDGVCRRGSDEALDAASAMKSRTIRIELGDDL